MKLEESINTLAAAVEKVSENMNLEWAMAKAAAATSLDYFTFNNNADGDIKAMVQMMKLE